MYNLTVLDILSKAAIDLTEDDDDVIPDVAPCIKGVLSEKFSAFS